MTEVFATRRSSFIGQVEFDKETDTLVVEFQDGKRFAYFNVTPSTYRNFTLAPSAGEFFHRHIKDRYGYEEV